MHPSPLRQFVETLRSAKMKQSYSDLRVGDRFSAAGLACDVYVMSHPGARWEGNVFASEDGRRSTILLPERVAKWLGFASTDPTFLVKILYRDLRPEMEGLTRNELQRAEADGDPHIIKRAKYRREAWDEIKDKTYEGEETFLGLNDFLHMRFDQIASVINQR